MKKVYVAADNATDALERVKSNFYYDTAKAAKAQAAFMQRLSFRSKKKPAKQLFLVTITPVPPAGRANNKSLRKTSNRVRPSLPFKGPIQTCDHRPLTSMALSAFKRGEGNCLLCGATIKWYKGAWITA